MVILRPINLRWIDGMSDDPGDLCAHGEVEFRIGDDTLLDAAIFDGLTVSAAALYLLRTLSRPHTREAPVGHVLFPHCGHTMYDLSGEEDVYIMGCNLGVDFKVWHVNGVVIRSYVDGEWRVDWSEWRAAVFAFAVRVSEYYAACPPRQLPSDPEDAAGFRKFLAEWERRRGVPLGKLQSS